MRRLLVAGNWKMHGSMKMTAELISGVAAKASTHANGQLLAYDILVCPPALYIAEASKVSRVEATPIAVGAQNVSPYDSGAYTGELALSMLAELGCSYVLLGHSERREHYDESDQVVAEKFSACTKSDTGVIPVLCIGETLAEREAGETEAVVARQINVVLEMVGISGFAGIFGHAKQQAVIAYEPVWAIGTGKTATPEQAQSVHKFIRALLAEHDQNVANSIKILYGGSVKPSNAEELFGQEDIDGGLVGGASLDVESFAGICEAAQKLAVK